MLIVQLLVVLALFGSFANATEPPPPPTAPSVAHFTPQGTLKNVRQVTVRFSAPMLSFGDPRSSMSPFDILCSEEGTELWIDSRNWVYDFARDLPAGVQCTFRLRPDLTTLEATQLSGPNEFTFSTGGPAILSSRPYEGAILSGIPLSRQLPWPFANCLRLRHWLDSVRQKRAC